MTAAGQGPLIRRPIDEVQVARILAIEDPVLRNLWITFAYHDLAVGMTRIAGLRNVSWVAFATWASKTAGVSIRKEQLSDLLRTHLEESDDWAHVLSEVRVRLLDRAFDDVNAAVARIFNRSIDRMSEVIAEGNRTVFAELGPIFARLASLDDGARNPGTLEAFVAGVKAVDAVDGAATERLRQAFRIYHVIWHSPDGALAPRTATQQILLANGLIGLTEQIRLQSAIRGALDAVIEVGLGHVFGPILDQFVPAKVLHLLEEALERVWRRAVTKHLLTLGTPNGVLDLSEDVPVLAPDRRFPEDLAAVGDPSLSAFLLQYDRTGGLGHPSGAKDWGSLNDRMNTSSTCSARASSGHRCSCRRSPTTRSRHWRSGASPTRRSEAGRRAGGRSRSLTPYFSSVSRRSSRPRPGVSGTVMKPSTIVGRSANSSNQSGSRVGSANDSRMKPVGLAATAWTWICGSWWAASGTW